jgi:hypothetical protein
MKRIRVGFANTLIQFVDRDRGIKQIYGFGERYRIPNSYLWS